MCGGPIARSGDATGPHKRNRLPAGRGRAILPFLVALLCVCATAVARAQTAIVAGQLTNFGSTLTNSIAVAVDSSQNAYVLTSAGAVYKETLTAAPGTYTETYLFTTPNSLGSGIAVDAAGANIFVATGTGDSVVEYTGSGTSYSLGTTFSGFSGTASVAVDASDNVYIADASTGYLWKETLSGSSYTQTRIATGLGAPNYVTIDSTGTLFVYSDQDANTTGTFSRITGSGTTYTKSILTIAGFASVTGLAVDGSDNLYVAGSNAGIITGSYVYKVALSGTTYTPAPYYQTGTGVGLDSAGDIYLVSPTENYGTKLTIGSGYQNFGSVGPGSPASMTIAFTVTSSGGRMGTPSVVTQGLTGYDFTLGTGSTCTSGTSATAGHSCNVVVQFSPQASGSRLGAVGFVVGGRTLASSFLGGVGFTPLAAYQAVTLQSTIACPTSCSSSLPNGLSNGRGISVDPAGNIWVANSTAAQILKFPAGSETPVVFNTTSTCQPVGTAIDGEGNVFYTCNGESNIYELVGGAATAVAIPISYNGTKYSTDDHLSVDAAGNLYPTSYQPASNLFFKIAAGTQTVSLLATAPTGARFVGAVTDAAGNTFAPDYNNDILYELPAGANTLTTLFSGAPLQAPHAIAEDAAGSLYVTTTVPNTSGNGNSPLLRFSAGNYTATPASLSVPGGDSLYITPNGDLYTVYSNSTLAVYSRSLFALTYTNTPVGQTSASQTVVLENDGTAPLTISPPSAGLNPGISTNFTYDPASTCPQLSSASAPFTLNAGSSCNQIIEFTPQQAGSVSGSVITTDNSANVSGSTQTIQISGTATAGTPTITVANASGILGQSVKLSVTVSGGGVAPTGPVSFQVGSGPTVTAQCSGGTSSETCTATYSTSAGVNAGTNTITASFTGGTSATDPNYASGSNTGTLTLAAAPTASTVTSGTNPSIYESSVTFTGTVTSTYGTPTGTLTFYDGSTAIGTGTLNSSGVATFMTSTLLGGTHAITVGYPATGNFAASTSSPAVSQVVNTTSNYTNTLTSSNLTPSFGSAVTFTDTLSPVNGVTPTGTVKFYSATRIGGTTTLLSSAPVGSTGTASFTISSLPIGTAYITAQYGGNTNYTQTTSAPVQEVVSSASVLSSLITSNANPTYGSGVTLTDQLPILANTPPTGTVTFYNGATILGIVNANASGNTQLITSALPAGTDTVKAVYNGDGNYSPSTSNSVTETVAKINVPTFTLASTNTSPVYGTSVTFTANLGAAGGNYPTGTVIFSNNGTQIGTGTIGATGVATFTTTNLPATTDTISASYNGDNNFNSSTSNIVTETVAKVNVPTDLLATSNLNPVFGTSITLTDTLGQVNSTYPTGTVTFYNGTTQIGTGTVTSGVATLTLSNLPGGTDPIKAVYGGDSSYNTATSNILAENVTPVSGYSDVLTTSNSTPSYGTSVTFTDTFPAVSGVYPTGTVTFYNGSPTTGTPIGTGTISPTGVATLTTTSLPVSLNAITITASYPGDGNFAKATSNGVAETVGKATGYANTLTTTNANPTYGTSITLTDTIAAVNGVYPTGSVTFYNGVNSIGTGTLSATGVATLMTSSLPANTDTITAGYVGDNTFAGSTSNAVTETITKATVASNVLTTSNATPAFGGSVTLTDTLSGINGVYPTGTITFYNGTPSTGTPIGTGVINATGVATLTTTTLPVGTDSITASFTADNSFNNSTSNALTETVAKATGYSDVLTTSNATPAYGSSVTLTDTLAAVNGVYPTGTVTFYNGTPSTGISIGTGTISTTGIATLTTTNLPAGTDSITAGYQGDNTFAGATSNALTETVAKATGYSDVLTTSNATPAYGSSVTLTDTLAAVNGVYPTGTVTFYNGTPSTGISIGTGTISATGVATLTTTNLPAGLASITAGYQGDTTFAGATSNALTETVAKASGYGDVLTTSNANPTYGDSVTFTDSFAAVNGVYPTGSVTFYGGTTAIGTVVISSTGVATITRKKLPVGTDTITAGYLGDNTFAGATSNAITETVAKVDVPSDVLTTSASSPSFGGSVTLTDTVGALDGTYPSGIITFYNGSTSIGTGTLSATGVATLTLSTLPTGTDGITADFPGDATFAQATSNTVNVIVAKVGGSNTLTTSNPSPVFGSGVTFTTTLGTFGNVAPTGTVTFSSGTLVLGTGTVSNGVATIATNALPVGSDSVTATYNGDGNYTTSTSNIVKETVTQATLSSDVLAASPTSTSFGQSVTLTDVLTGVNGVTPTGSVSFYNGTTLLSTVTVDGTGTATLNTTSLPVATNTLHATYSSDPNYAASTSNQVTVTVGKIAAGSSDTATGTGTFGAPSTQVSIGIPFTGPSAPTGDITLNDTHGNSITLKAATCTTSGANLTCTATLPTANDPGGANTVTVSQATDPDYTSSTGGGTITLNKAAPTTGDGVNGTGTYGAPTTPINVSLPYAGPVAPTGGISVIDSYGNSVNIAAASCTTSATALTCSANLPTANVPFGPDTATVTQVADNNYGGSSGTGPITINKAVATNTDTATGTGTYGASATAVTVKIPYAGVKSPVGDITVTDTHNNTVTIPASGCTAAGGTLTCTANLHTANEPLGTNTVNVTQLGDGNYTGDSGSGSITIGPAATTTGDTAIGSGTYGAPTSSVKVSIPYAGATAPTGAITLNDTHTNTLTFQASSCTAASGTLTCTVNLPTANEPIGGNLVLISQVADPDYAGSSGSGTVTIARAGATTGDTANGNGTYGAATTPVTLNIPYTGATAPAGSITVKDSLGNTVSIAATACTSSGTALTCTANLPTANEPVGTNNVTVGQIGDGNYGGSTGSGTVTIGLAATTSSDTANGTGNYGDATTQVIVTIPFAGVASPTGAISVTDSFGNTVTVAASTCITSGSALTCTASLPTSNVPTGKDPVTVKQVADPNYNGSTGSGNVTINPAGARGDDSATGSGSYGAPSTPITVVIPFSGTAPIGGITITDTFGNTIAVAPANCKASATALVCAASLPTANEPVGSNSVTVGQVADPNHAASTGSGTLMISPAAATANDTATGAGNYGSATTAVTATIPYAGAAAPSGAVTVTDNLGNTVTVPASTCSAANQTLTCSLNLPTANEPQGNNQVTVNQAADTNYEASTGSGTVTITTSPISPVGSTASGVQNVTIVQGTDSTLLTATLAYGGTIPPSGAVTFTVANGSPVTATCSTGSSPETCTANYPTNSLQIGTFTITANEAADPNYTAGSATGTLTVAAGSVSPILDSISYVGNVLIVAGTPNAALTANITYTGPVPTGALTFNLPGGTPVTATCTAGPSPLVCMATYPTATLAAGSYVVTAAEASDSNYPQGEATALLTVSPSASTPVSPILATGSYVNSVLVPYGTATASLYATIVYNGPPPTGAITFTVIGGTGVVAQGACTSGNSPMTCTADYPTGDLGIGSYKIQVNLAADSNYPAGSATGTLTISEVAASTNDSVTGNGNYGDPTTPITISIPYPGSIAPTGAVTVTDSYNNTITVQASVCTAAAGVLSCPANLPTANVPFGTDAATVSQGPDDIYAASSGKGSITIGKATATTIDSANGTGSFGAANSPVTVTIPYTGTTAPTGAITVSDGFGNTATIAARNCTSAGGILTCTTNLASANEPLGNNPLTVTQIGDPNYTGSTGTGILSISKAGATTGDTATGTGTYGAPTTPVTVTIPFVGATAPAGAITVADTHNNTVTFPASTCASTGASLTCTASLPTANEPVGSNTVTVSQTGDPNYNGSTGTGTVTINKAPATTGDTASGTGTYGAATTPVTVTLPYAGTASPTGAITLSDTLGETATVQASACTAAAGMLTCTVNLPTVNEPVGSNTVTVTQTADPNYSGSTGTGTVTINKAGAASDTVTGTGTYGAAITPVTISIPYVGAAPTGVVTLADTHGDNLSVSTCTAAGGTLTCTANLPTANEPVGSNTVTVSQAADANHSASTGTGTVTINKAAATSTDTVTGTGTYGSATTQITVTIPYVGSAAPTGAITVTDSLGNTVTVQASTCTASAGLLTCAITLPTANEPLGPNALTITQAPDANYSGSTGSGSVTLNKPGATTGDTVTGTGTYGSATTPVTVNIPFIGATAPAGAITLTDTHGNTVTVAASSCTTAKGVLTCTANMPTANEPVGSNTITVNQAPDAIFNGSTGAGSVTLNKAPATTGDTVTGSGSYGAATTSVTVDIPYAGAAAPTGAVTVTDSLGNTVTVPASSCTAAKGVLTCTASLSTANEPLGTNTLTISQAADVNYSGSTGTGSVTIGQTRPTLTAPTITPLNATFGTSVTITQTVPAGETGTVTFYNGTTVLGTATIAKGVATLTTSALPLGTDSITATANGDTNFLAATSPAVTDTIAAATTAITLASSQSTVTVGSSVTFTAKVSTSGTATISGTVIFYDGTTAIGTASVTNGVASMGTATLTVGTHNITATFTPATGSTLSAATSTAVAEVVTQAVSSLALTSSQNPAVVTQSVTFSATVPASIAGVIPTGKVTFYDGTTAIGTVQLNSSGVATFTTETLAGGAHTITAAYNGDSIYAPSTSNVVPQGISDFTVGTTTATVGADPGAAAAFHITINPVNGISFSDPVVLTVTGLPANFTATFAQGTVTPGSNGTSTTMTVQTFAQALTAMERQHHTKSLEAAAAWACLLPLLGLRRIRRRLPKSLLMLALVIGSFGVMAPITGCSGGGYFGPQPTSYTLTVTGTSGTLQRSTTVTLNVH